MKQKAEINNRMKVIISLFELNFNCKPVAKPISVYPSVFILYRFYIIRKNPTKVAGFHN